MFYILYRKGKCGRAANSFEAYVKCSEKLSRPSAPEGFLHLQQMCLWHISHFPCLFLSSLSHCHFGKDKEKRNNTPSPPPPPPQTHNQNPTGYCTTGMLSAKSDKMLLFSLFQDFFPRGSFQSWVSLKMLWHIHIFSHLFWDPEWDLEAYCHGNKYKILLIGIWVVDVGEKTVGWRVQLMYSFVVQKGSRRNTAWNWTSKLVLDWKRTTIPMGSSLTDTTIFLAHTS